MLIDKSVVWSSSKSSLKTYAKFSRMSSVKANKRLIYKKTLLLSMGALSSLILSMPTFAQPQKLNSPDSTDSQVSSYKDSQMVIDSAVNDLHQASELSKRLNELAKQKKLSEHPTWLRLYYYQPETKSATKSSTKDIAYKSKIQTSDFFISDEGKTNPKIELEAFITAMVTEETNGNNSVSCRFPARTHWLKEQLGLAQGEQKCPDFDAWFQKLDPKRLSVVFAEEYPNRAVSAFGHTLMLIDSKASLVNPRAIDKAYALNDTVAGNPDDPFIKYAINSIVGGYPNDITIEPYPKKLAEYLQQDNRDVWTYTLNLTDAEIQQIMRHVYETKDLQLPYYLTLDNCASEILRYIDVVRPEGNLLDQFTLAVVPSDVVRLLYKEGLINSENYSPADATLAQAKLNNPQMSDLPSSSIDANHNLIPTHLRPVDNNALNAHSLQRVMIGAGSEDDTGYVSLAYRGGFNGPLDRSSGFPQNYHLEVGSVALRVYKDTDKNTGNHDSVELQELALLRGRSFNPINTARKGDSLLSSWGINLQAIKVKDGSQMNHNTGNGGLDNDHLVGSFGYEKGISVAFGKPDAGSGQLPPQLCYALGTGLGQVGKGLSKGYRVGAGVNIGCRYQFSPNARLIGEVQVPYWYHGDSTNDQIKSGYWQPILSLGAQYDFDKNNAIRLKGSYELQDNIDGREDIQLAYVKYF
ncbi:DUF4105 domain-containing protein [Psychrobacter sp.]|uniref:Lnb N-terminal periplasmic domain-containing protein n=1 Tax=Psychrobacter sp. TaxID=56811 RepID=UPI0025DEE112|nr:DUF4105 domain-containing protein [Psychrobacter sp.]